MELKAEVFPAKDEVESHIFLPDEMEVEDVESITQVGPETIDFFSSWTYPDLSHDRIVVSTEFIFGYGRKTHVAVFQKDCETIITDISFNATTYDFGFNSTYDGIQYLLFFPIGDELERSEIYNSDRWEVKVCVVVNLIDSPDVIEYQSVSFFVAGSGTPVSLEIFDSFASATYSSISNESSSYFSLAQKMYFSLLQVHTETG